MKRKIYRIFFVILFVWVVAMNSNVVNADLGKEVDPSILNPIVTNPGNGKINSMFNTISTTVVVVLESLGVAGLVFNGFKYMSAGAEGKSKIKENMIWILFGMLLITSAGAVIGLISKAGNQAIPKI